MMNRLELSILSQAHAVAMTAMVAEETGHVPVHSAYQLCYIVFDDGADIDRPDWPAFQTACRRFLIVMQQGRSDLGWIARAGREMRDAVARAMAFVPVDINRVDIHG